MIFLTVGAQMPFDRLVAVVDAWAGRHPDRDVLAQIGDTALRPRHLRWRAQLAPADFREAVRRSRVVVAHAGMGSILTALELERPILVLPRRADLRETRNDHQFGTARALRDAGRVAVAFDEDELACRLDAIDHLVPADPVPAHASFGLLAGLRRFIHEPNFGSPGVSDAPSIPVPTRRPAPAEAPRRAA